MPDGTFAELPAWMTDFSSCDHLSQGAPVVVLSALTELRELLDSLCSNAGQNVQEQHLGGMP